MVGNGQNIAESSDSSNVILFSNTCLVNEVDCGTDDGNWIIPEMGLNGKPKQLVQITLPAGFTYRNIDWLSLYCRRFKISFGDIRINKNEERGKYLVVRSKIDFATTKVPIFKKAADFSNLQPFI